MAITANKKFWTEFIDIYRSLPSLWNTKDENYNNRESRSLAWNKLVVKLQEVEPDANQDSVKRKINTFRSNFNREVRKIRHTQKKELSTDVYNPTLWYFDQLSFLLKQEKYNSDGTSIDGHYDEEMSWMGLTTAKSEMEENVTMPAELHNPEYMRDNNTNSQYERVVQNKAMLQVKCNNNRDNKLTEPEQNTLIEYNTTVAEALRSDITPTVHKFAIKPQIVDSTENHVNNVRPIEKSTESVMTSNTSTARPNLRRTKYNFKSQDPYSRNKFKNNVLTSLYTDEAAIYGQAWACGFRKLNSQQKLFAKKAIDEILILGQLNALKLNMVPINTTLLERSSDEG